MLNRGPSAVSSTATVAWIPNAVITRFRKSTMAVVFIASVVFARRVGLAGAAPPHSARRGARSAARRRRKLRRPDHVVGQVLLADRPEVVHEPIQRHTRGIPQE